jgi:hypothetical protein
VSSLFYFFIFKKIEKKKKEKKREKKDEGTKLVPMKNKLPKEAYV